MRKAAHLLGISVEGTGVYGWLISAPGYSILPMSCIMAGRAGNNLLDLPEHLPVVAPESQASGQTALFCSIREAIMYDYVIVGAGSAGCVLAKIGRASCRERV